MSDKQKCTFCGALIYDPCDTQSKVDRCELPPFTPYEPIDLMKLHDETMRKLDDWVRGVVGSVGESKP